MAIERDHTWTKITLCPVSTLPDDEGDPYIFVDPDHQAIAERYALYGCFDCGTDIVEGYGTPCKGEGGMKDELPEGLKLFEEVTWPDTP